MTPTPPPVPGIEFRRMTVSYGTHPVVWDVSAAFPTGSLNAIVGPNGAGKSTLLKAALGLVPRDAGQAFVHGRPLLAAMDEVAFVPQASAVDWDFPTTVREVVEMGRYRHAGWFRRLRRTDRDVVARCLDHVGMTPFADRQIGQLSGGQRQRVFLARALAQEASVILMDEPFAGVDARTERALLDLLSGLRDGGSTIVIVHHELRTVRERFDNALVLNVRAIATGPVGDVLDDDLIAQAYGGVTASATDERAVPWAG